jgi:hypothetical protein
MSADLSVDNREQYHERVAGLKSLLAKDKSKPPSNENEFGFLLR